jgi:arylsulfatase A-like enzyme
MPLLPANHGIPVNEPDIIRIVQREGPQVYLPQFYTPDDWRRYLWGYYRLVEKADRETGRVLEALRRSGQEDRTLVIFTADHGDGGAAHQWNQKMVLYEEVVRVPLIMAGPRVKGGRVESRLAAASLDLFPTCCEAAGIPVPEGLEGRSLLPLARAEPVEDWRDAVFIETALIPERGNDAREQARNRGRCIVTGRWKYSVWPWGRHREHLVDLVNDPGEMVNEAVFSGNAEVLASMRARLAEWCRRTGDSFAVPGYEDIGPHHGWAEVEANRRRFPPQ